MKRIFSLLTIVAILVSMFSVTALAAGHEVTLSVDLEGTKAKVGDEFELLTTLDTSFGVKGFGFKIAFDSNDIELGVSAESKAVADEYADYIGTEDYPTLDSITQSVLGRDSYVSDTYASTYDGYKTKNFGSATIGYEELNGRGQIGFAASAQKAKDALGKVTNMVIGGVVLKVKTTEAKQTDIILVEAVTTDGNNAKTDMVFNTITLDLNGYGESTEPTAASIGLSTAAGQAIPGPINVKNSIDGSEYTINSALAFVSCVDADKAEPVKTVITRADSDKVLEIPAVHKTKIGDKTYFVAAVTSIKDSSFNKVFTAKAVAQAGEYTVDGAEATGTYAE